MSDKTEHGADPQKYNLPRFFVRYRQISWVVLIASFVWGAFGFYSMPQRKDPDIPVKQSLVVVPWPGASAAKIEQLVTRRIEEAVAQNVCVDKIESVSRANVSLVYVYLDEYANDDTGKQFDDVNQKLQSIHDLPPGAGPVTFIKDFGDTSALMLTVASPKTPDSEVNERAHAVQQALEVARRQDASVDARQRFSIVVVHPRTVQSDLVVKPFELLAKHLEGKGIGRRLRVLAEPDFVALDGLSDRTDAQLLAATNEYLQDSLQLATLHPDAWAPAVIRDPATTLQQLAPVAGDRYTYREMDDFTDKIEKAVKIVPQVSKVSRAGVLPENVFLYYSQDRLAAYGLEPAQLPAILGMRNIDTPGGQLDAQRRTTIMRPSGELKSERELGNIAVAPSPAGTPVYLRDLVQVSRSYQSPASYLNYYNVRDADGRWRRHRAITLAIQMRPNNKITEFSTGVDAALASVRKDLPADLTMARTSDQPLQVSEMVRLLMGALVEAVVLVVLVSWIGFWEWRSALLMALSIPVTLALTFAFASAFGVDIQQISIGSLIVALGLLVHNPVVAGDAIKVEMGAGESKFNAAWRGPTRLGNAILYITITNIVAYLPFLIMRGDTGRFMHAAPIVIACSLVASILVVMTLLPFLSYYILKPVREEPLASRKQRGLAALYVRLGKWCIRHRKPVFALSLLFLMLGGLVFASLKQGFFPTDLQYLSTVDIFLPEDATINTTDRTARQAAQIVREVAEKYGREHGKSDVLASVTTFVGQGGPRFWFSINPEHPQPNYAQLVVQVKDKRDTMQLAGPLQQALSERLIGARTDVRQLETGKPVQVPVAVRISGTDMGTLRDLAEKVKAIYRKTPLALRIRDDWGAPGFRVNVETDSDRANLAGLTNLDVAASTATGLSGMPIGVLREGNKQIPIVFRLRPEERAQNLKDLYVYSVLGPQRVPIQQVAHLKPGLEPAVIRRRNQYRTITVGCYPAEGHMASETLNAVRDDLDALKRTLPQGYWMETAGEKEEQIKGFTQLAIVLVCSTLMLYIALALQFTDAVKPFIVFAAVPYGIVGSLIGLRVMGLPFGFMGFLGIVSLIGVIISHIIVLFDNIEEGHHEGKDLEEAVLDAGLQRLRPILITVAATVIALFPLAKNGGPIWEPLCYAQIGGLSVATFVTLLLVPVVYAIFVYDLKIVKWSKAAQDQEEQ